MRCVIVLGGDFGVMNFTLDADDFVIACDSGYMHCLHLGITPHILLGDMDSLNIALPPDITTEVFPVMKDDTDCMLAVKEGISRGYKEFALICGFGGRIDHTLANISALGYLVENACVATLHGASETAQIIFNEEAILDYAENLSLSLFAFGGDAMGVTLQGMKYPLDKAILKESFPLGVSNFIVEDQGTVSVKSGKLLILRVILDA